MKPSPVFVPDVGRRRCRRRVMEGVPGMPTRNIARRTGLRERRKYKSGRRAPRERVRRDARGIGARDRQPGARLVQPRPHAAGRRRGQRAVLLHRRAARRRDPAVARPVAAHRDAGRAGPDREPVLRLPRASGDLAAARVRAVRDRAGPAGRADPRHEPLAARGGTQPGRVAVARPDLRGAARRIGHVLGPAARPRVLAGAGRGRSCRRCSRASVRTSCSTASTPRSA